MKFSVLLPTRNRLEYLRYAVQTVLRQDYADWELIISDNFSEDDIAGYVQSLNDERIKYYRTDSFVPVTDNWNNALDKSSGDYVIMLGDDDGLLQGYFTAMHGLIKEYSAPDVIYSRAYIYAYPGVIPASPDGYLQQAGCAEFLLAADQPFLLDKARALGLVRHSMNFRLRFDYNMQYSTISRKFIESLRDKGQFFQSPFPDYYATNVAFLRAERVLVYPHPMVVIGITPKSYGFFHFNNREAEGMAFLQSRSVTGSHDKLRQVLLPGTNINTGWLHAMEIIKANYGSEFNLQVNYRRYRLLQIISVYQGYYLLKVLPLENLQELKRLMRSGEKIMVNIGLLALFILKKLLPLKPRHALAHRLTIMVGQYPDFSPQIMKGQYKSLVEVFEQVSPHAG